MASNYNSLGFEVSASSFFQNFDCDDDDDEQIDIDFEDVEPAVIELKKKKM